MPRIARIVLDKIPYHVTQRGNGRQRVFFDGEDYRLYLDLLRDYAKDACLELWSYCLMPNHVHLIVVPDCAEAMASALGRTHADYARYFHLKRRTCGHVWQARYFSCPLDAAHLWRAAAYIERNPVRARMVEDAREYEWSSARAHLGLADGPVPLDLVGWRAAYTQQSWNEVLETGVADKAFGRRLQEASRRGRPLGGEEFVQELEKRAGRPLRARPVGRPRKQEVVEERQLSLKIGV